MLNIGLIIGVMVEFVSIRTRFKCVWLYAKHKNLKSAVYKTCFVPPSTFHPSVIVEPNQPVCGETELSLQAHPTSAETDVVNSSLKDYSMYNKNVTIKPMDIDTNDFRYKSFDFTKGQYLKFGNTSDCELDTQRNK